MSSICPEFIDLDHFARSVADDPFLRQEPDKEEEEDEGDVKDDADDDEEDHEGYSELSTRK